MLNNRTVIVSRHFQHRVEIFLKRSCLMVDWAKRKYILYQYLEFQERGSTHSHWFIRIFKSLNIQNEDAYIKFLTKQMLSFQTVWMIQSYWTKLSLTTFMFILELAGNTIMNVASPMVDTLLRKQLLQNNSIVNLAMMKSKKFQYWECTTKASQKLC